MTSTFCGFDVQETSTYEKINKFRMNMLNKTGNRTNSLQFESIKAPGEALRLCNMENSSVLKLRGLSNTKGVSTYDCTEIIGGLVNFGNSCYMNSVIQCLRCVAPLVSYFIKGNHYKDINRSSLYMGSLAREIGSAFCRMTTEEAGSVTLRALKNIIAEHHFQFVGNNQHDAHEFLIFLLNGLHEDLKGGNLDLHVPGVNSPIITEKRDNREISIISSLFQGEHSHVVICSNCSSESVSHELFTVLTLSLPSRGNYSLMSLLRYHYDSCIVDYNCPACSRKVRSSRKTYINKLPRYLIFHLNRFEYIMSARKKSNYIDFPKEKLGLKEFTSEGCKLHSYNLLSVSNHNGNMNNGHYTSYCKSLKNNIWYLGDDNNISKLKTSVSTSLAYLLVYNSMHIYR